MRMKFVLAAALLLPATSLAQNRDAATAQSVSVEIVANGQLDVPADVATMNVTYSETDISQAAADKKGAAALARIMAVLSQNGVPAGAISDLPGDVASTLAVTGDSMMALDSAADDTNATPAQVYSATGGRSLRLGSWIEAIKVKAALEAADLSVSPPVVTVKDLTVARRKAKAKALRDARADADVYAAEMGMRVIRVARISEAGNNLVLPGLQTKFEQAIMSGPSGMTELFQQPPGYVRVDAGLVVEFVLGK